MGEVRSYLSAIHNSRLHTHANFFLFNEWWLIDRTGSGESATCCFCYCQFFESCVAGVGPDACWPNAQPESIRRL
jgi:hypothetical protein